MYDFLYNMTWMVSGRSAVELTHNILASALCNMYWTRRCPLVLDVIQVKCPLHIKHVTIVNKVLRLYTNSFHFIQSVINREPVSIRLTLHMG
jgi:hypothetical protein